MSQWARKYDIVDIMAAIAFGISATVAVITLTEDPPKPRIHPIGIFIADGPADNLQAGTEKA